MDLNEQTKKELIKIGITWKHYELRDSEEIQTLQGDIDKATESLYNYLLEKLPEELKT